MYTSINKGGASLYRNPPDYTENQGLHSDHMIHKEDRLVTEAYMRAVDHGRRVRRRRKTDERVSWRVRRGEGEEGRG